MSDLSWWRPFVGAAAILGLVALVGCWLGDPGFAVGVAALGLLAWQYRQRQQILHHLASRRRWAADHGRGGWGTLRRLLYRQQQRTYIRQLRLLERLRDARAIADALPDAVVVVERLTQRVQWFNPAATTLLGLTVPDDLGAALVPRLQPLPLAHWLAGGRHAEPLDAASPINPGIRLHLRLVAWSEHHWLLIARDVSKLLYLEQVRRDFVANVSHELRTPLTVLHGYLELLDADDASVPAPETRYMLAEMHHQSQRMRQLVDDLLALSRLESQQIALEPVPMAPLLRGLIREAEAHSQGRHRIVLDDSARVDLRGSGKELHSAFSNLLSNAVRYTPEGGCITLRFSEDTEKGVVIAVSDTGPGIPAEHLPRLTERFYRISRSRSPHSGGTGLGLAIVKHVLGLHRARLEISSELGAGSTFACHFDAEHVVARED